MPVIKRQNHRIHPCEASRKSELLHYLIENYPSKSILLITAHDVSAIKLPSKNTNMTIIQDNNLSSLSDQFDVVISYDLPEKAIVYMARLAKAKEYALIILDEGDQSYLYGIELLNGRTILQEIIKGFEPSFGIEAENQQKAEAKARRSEREARDATEPKNRDQKSRRDTRPERKFDDKSRTDRRPARGEDDGFSAKKQQGSKPRFIGKDENGKPIFEGKTRERNHYIDGTPRTEEEKRNRTKYGSKPKFFGDKEKSADDRKPSDREKKPYGEKKSFGDKKPHGEKKPYDKEGKKSFGEKKSYGDKKSYDKPSGDDKKPYGDKKPYNGRNPSETPATTKRPPRRIDVKSLKPKDKE